MNQKRVSRPIVSGLLALGVCWLAAPPASVQAAAAVKPGQDWQVENHYRRTDLYLQLGSYLALSKDAAPSEGCNRLGPASPNSPSTVFLCPRSYLFVPKHRLSVLKEIRLRPYGYEETDEEDPGPYAYVKHVDSPAAALKTTGSTPAIVTVQVVEMTLPANQGPVKLPAKPKVLKTIGKLSLKLGEDNAIPLNLSLTGQQNIGILVSADIDQAAKKAQVIYLEASDQSELWMRQESPLVYEFLNDTYAPAFAYADVRFVYR